MSYVYIYSHDNELTYVAMMFPLSTTQARL